MTTTTPAKRPVVGLLFALAGLLATLSIIFNIAHIAVGGVWLDVIVDLALTIGFLLLFLGKSSGIVARVLFLVAAVGWAILALSALVPLGSFSKVGLVLALVGSLLGGIFAFTGKIFSRLANVLFLIATVFVALVLLNSLVGFIAGTVALIIVIVYAVALLIAGLLIAARR